MKYWLKYWLVKNWISSMDYETKYENHHEKLGSRTPELILNQQG